jgi:hypothetical protein
MLNKHINDKMMEDFSLLKKTVDSYEMDVSKAKRRDNSL